MGSYKDSAGRIEDIREAIRAQDYAAAKTLLEAGQYEQAIAAFKALGDYKDSAGRSEEVRESIRARDYAAAEALYEAGQYEQAYAEFVKLKGYKDVDSLLEKDEHLIAVRKAAFTTIGNTVSFGTYEQDNNTANGKEEIEWVVLATEGDRSLVISKYALDCQPYNTKYTNVTWETCSLRKWLNDTFLNAAFSKEEQAMISTMTVSADKNPDYSTSPGSSTQDQIFLLSIPEVKRYFSSDEARKCVPTAYAIAQGADTSNKYSVSGKATCWWWLRSPGFSSSSAAYVYFDGSVSSYGRNVSLVYDAVRPALWINLAQQTGSDSEKADNVFRMKPSLGVEVTNGDIVGPYATVESSGLAYSAGLRAYDVIFSINGEKIKTADLTYLTGARSTSILRKILNLIQDIKNGIDNNMPIDMLEIDLKNVWNLLGEIIGESYDDELLDQLFSRFCVGK